MRTQKRALPVPISPSRTQRDSPQVPRRAAGVSSRPGASGCEPSAGLDRHYNCAPSCEALLDLQNRTRGGTATPADPDRWLRHAGAARAKLPAPRPSTTPALPRACKTAGRRHAREREPGTFARARKAIRPDGAAGTAAGKAADGEAYPWQATSRARTVRQFESGDLTVSRSDSG